MRTNDDDNNFLFFPTAKLKAKIIDFLAGISVQQEKEDGSSRLKGWLNSFNHLFFPLVRTIKRQDPLEGLKIPKSFEKSRSFHDIEAKEPRFEILCSGSTQLHKERPKLTGKDSKAPTHAPQSKAQDGGEAKSAERVTGDNYQKKYEENKRAQKELAEQKAKEAKTLDTKHEDTTKRNRAVQLRDEMYVWKAKMGTGEYEDTVVKTQIETLEREYYSIDYKHRPE